MECFGINPEVTKSKDERHALKTLRETIRFVDNRYEVRLLWKPNAELPNNFAAALQQYKRSKQRLMHDPVTHDLNSATIEKDLRCGYIHRTPHDEVPSTGWLQPEHGVLHSNKPGKLRRVSNARAKYKGVCLNDMLLTGTDLLANLLGIILRFRKKRYPLSVDIEAMYKQVSVCPADRKFLQFLWGETEPTFSNTFVSSLAQNALHHALILLSKPVPTIISTNIRTLNVSFETIFSFPPTRYKKLLVSSAICDSSFHEEGSI